MEYEEPPDYLARMLEGAREGESMMIVSGRAHGKTAAMAAYKAAVEGGFLPVRPAEPKPRILTLGSRVIRQGPHLAFAMRGVVIAQAGIAIDSLRVRWDESGTVAIIPDDELEVLA